MTQGFTLVGPTAVGKTAVAHVLAGQHGFPILSTDSMLVYRGMDIGTAKPTVSERAGVTYYGMDLVDPGETCSVIHYLETAFAHAHKSDGAIASVQPSQPPDAAILAGGTGLYVKALLVGLDDNIPAADPVLRASLEGQGVEDLQLHLHELDPEALDTLADAQNPRRLIRAIEIASAGVTLSRVWQDQPKPKVVGLRMDRQLLRRRISKRVGMMFTAGLSLETKELLKQFPKFSETALGAIGYREAIDLHKGNLPMNKAIDSIVVRTARLAKRQMTFFSRQFDMTWVDIDPEEAVEAVAERVQAAWDDIGPIELKLPKPKSNSSAFSSVQAVQAAQAAQAKPASQVHEPKPSQVNSATPPSPAPPSPAPVIEPVKTPAIPKPAFSKPTSSKPTSTGYQATSRHRMCDIPARQRPREVLDRLGVTGVTEDVLLAIILRTGAPGKNVIDLAQEMLRDFGSLTELARAPALDLQAYPGMGPVKAQIVQCALQMATRMAAEQQPERAEVSSPESVALVMRDMARHLEVEIFWILLLDTKNCLLRPPVEVTKGLLNASLVHPREVFQEAVRHACAAVILVHNHPSGDPSPSPEDIKATRELVAAGGILGIQVIDHVIVGRCTDPTAPYYHSIRESGLVEFAD